MSWKFITRKAVTEPSCSTEARRPLTLATGLEAAGVNVIGTSPESIDLAEDREKFKHILEEIGLKQPQNEIAMFPEEAAEKAARIGYPILLRPSFVLGGRGMFIVYDEKELNGVVKEAFAVAPGKPVLLGQILGGSHRA